MKLRARSRPASISPLEALRSGLAARSATCPVGPVELIRIQRLILTESARLALATRKSSADAQLSPLVGQHFADMKVGEAEEKVQPGQDQVRMVVEPVAHLWPSLGQLVEEVAELVDVVAAGLEQAQVKQLLEVSARLSEPIERVANAVLVMQTQTRHPQSPSNALDQTLARV